MAAVNQSNMHDAIKEAIFSDILEAPVKLYYPEKDDWQPQVILSGIESYKYATFLNHLDADTRKRVLDTILLKRVELNVQVAFPTPGTLTKLPGYWNLQVRWKEKRSLQIKSNCTVAQLRSILSEWSSVEGASSFGLWFDGKPLSDLTCTLGWLGIRDGSVIEVRPRVLGGDISEKIGLNADMFAPKLDVDFRKVKDHDAIFVRGGKRYFRPCGWMRYALNVSKRYGDDRWLTAKGSAESGEWAVSYHGTKEIPSVRSIISDGYDTSRTVRNAYNFDINHCVYSSPLITTAEKYAEDVLFDNGYYRFVFQNRINPFEMVTNNIADDPYWGAGMDSMRPYGLLIKPVKHPKNAKEYADKKV